MNQKQHYITTFSKGVHGPPSIKAADVSMIRTVVQNVDGEDKNEIVVTIIDEKAEIQIEFANGTGWYGSFEDLCAIIMKDN